MEGLVGVSPGPDRATIISALDREIDQYSSLIPLLEGRAQPFLVPSESVEPGTHPVAAPVNELQALVGRFSNCNKAMHEMILRIQS